MWFSDSTKQVSGIITRGIIQKERGRGSRCLVKQMSSQLRLEKTKSLSGFSPPQLSPNMGKSISSSFLLAFQLSYFLLGLCPL